jgi:hypothetical protein
MLVIVLLSLSACGTTPGCRARSTGALGAASGAAIGAIAANAGLGLSDLTNQRQWRRQDAFFRARESSCEPGRSPS